MTQSRYKESRTLVRRICRLPGENRAEYRAKVARLRAHFERFNVDVSELCQWIMGLRKAFGDPDSPASFGVFGDFFLNPHIEGVESGDDQRDRLRLMAFDNVTGIRLSDTFGDHPIPPTLRETMSAAAQHTKTPTTLRLFVRIGGLQPAHRMILLKAAADWVVSRYQRGMENWARQEAAWRIERDAWQAAHPELTESVRIQFTETFKTLRDPDRNGAIGIRRPNPRVCGYDRLQGNLDNCAYAGEKGHGPLCWKYNAFVKAQKEGLDKAFNDKRFWDDAQRLLRYCAEKQIRPSNAFLSPNLPGILFKDDPRLQRASSVARLKKHWNAYIKYMELTPDSMLQYGRLPHCQRIGETWQKSKCEWNPHTELCRLYKNKLAEFDEQTLKLESQYREWRRFYLRGPRKPHFRYPSSNDLPMPKIFGDGFHAIDFTASLVRLRLDDMAEGEWIEFGFTPWPRHYPTRRQDVHVTSVHVNFIGSRARVGFRFDALHKQSRIGCAQDEIDELRSRVYPRQAQDMLFLDAARQRILDTFEGDPNRELRVLAVDLGEKGAHAAVYTGRRHEKGVVLKIMKIDRLYSQLPTTLDADAARYKSPPAFKADNDTRGVRKEHVARHLSDIGKGATKIAEYRQAHGGTAITTLRDYDFREVTRHVRWMIRDWVRHNAAQVIAAAEGNQCDLIVFESHRNQRIPGYEVRGEDAGRQKNQQTILSYGKIRHKVREKAVERGMRVVTVPEYKTSQVCSTCGKLQENAGLLRKNKKARMFKCEHCKMQLDSDANAARALARIFWGEIKILSPSVA